MNTQKDNHEEQVIIVKGMLLSNMLEHLNISLKQYFQKTSYSDRERHILNCKHCSRLKECVHMLLGVKLDPKTFCPNSRELKRLSCK